MEELLIALQDVSSNRVLYLSGEEMESMLFDTSQLRPSIFQPKTSSVDFSILKTSNLQKSNSSYTIFSVVDLQDAQQHVLFIL